MDQWRSQVYNVRTKAELLKGFGKESFLLSLISSRRSLLGTFWLIERLCIFYQVLESCMDEGGGGWIGFRQRVVRIQQGGSNFHLLKKWKEKKKLKYFRSVLYSPFSWSSSSTIVCHATLSSRWFHINTRGSTSYHYYFFQFARLALHVCVPGYSWWGEWRYRLEERETFFFPLLFATLYFHFSPLEFTIWGLRNV